MESPKNTISPALQQFIEDVGLRYEEEGLPRMAGRLAGWLLICDPPHQTAGELAEVLGASPGSISTATRTLVQCGLVERIGVPGQRSASFRIRTGAWSEMMGGWLEKTRKMRLLAERGVELLRDEEPEVKRRLVELRDFQAFIEKEIPNLLERWKEENQR